MFAVDFTGIYRYRHIWPFEHARVRLHRRPSEEARIGEGEVDDYVNASYVQPLGTTRRYIATQGPLPATFNDFWRYVFPYFTQHTEY
jgi:protein tyrosine phosphatase